MMVPLQLRLGLEAGGEAAIGAKVEFEVTKGPKGLQATNVTAA